MQKKLYRSETDKVLGGVCGGIAEYLNIDSTIVRLLWVILLFVSVGLIAYIVALIVMPLPPVGYYKQQNYNGSNYQQNGGAYSGTSYTNYSQNHGYENQPQYQNSYNSSDYQTSYRENQAQTTQSMNENASSQYQAEQDAQQKYYEAESHYKEENDK